MAEWTIAAVLKAAIPPGIVGSNPTPSASGLGVRPNSPARMPLGIIGPLARWLYPRRYKRARSSLLGKPVYNSPS